MAAENFTVPHKLTLNERKTLTLTGVTEVVSFDDTTVVLHTEMGALEVQGQELKLKNLSAEGGQVTVDGKIDALIYGEVHTGSGFWSRFFK